MAQRKPKKDRTSFIIAVILHVVLIGGVTFWAWKTGKLEQMRQAVLQYVRSDKKDQKPDAKPIQQKATPQAKLPPINQGLPPSASSGTRRAVAVDAPEAVGGGSFFQDTRTQLQGPGGGPSAASKPKEKAVVAPAAKPPAPPKPTFVPPPRTTIKQLFAERAKATAATESVGTEQIAKTGASDAGAVLSRISGASVVEGKFAVVRGLGDRYVPTVLNGAFVPSGDPYRRSASLDQFPAQLISKVTVTKTFTPDQPGTFTGGGVDVETKTFPDRPFASLSVGVDYNTQSTFNEGFLEYEVGGRDWLGMDDGSRALPAEVDYGVRVPSVVIVTPRPTSPLYPQAVADAATLDAQARALRPTQFQPFGSAPPLDHKFGLSLGDTAYFLGMPIGVIGVLNYKREFRFYDDGVQRRYQGEEVQSDYQDVRSLTSVNWVGMAGLSAQLWNDHDLTLNYLFSQTAQDSARQQEGTTISLPNDTTYRTKIQWVERNLDTLQLKGTSRFPALGDLRLDYLGALTKTTQDEPDTRLFNYAVLEDVPVVGINSLPDPTTPSRYFSELSEESRNFRLDVTLPFRQWSATEGKLKAGLNAVWSDRDFQERNLLYSAPGGGTPDWNGDPNAYLQPDNLGILSSNIISFGRTRYNWGRYPLKATDSSYTGSSAIEAAYLMTEFPLREGLRLVGGVRLEQTDIQLNTETVTDSGDSLSLQTNLVQDDILPSVGFVWDLSRKMVLKANYSRTIARPSFRELAPYGSYDPNLDIEVVGNPGLQITKIENWDLRWEWFPKPGEIVSASVFYKQLTAPIEQAFIRGDGSKLGYRNSGPADLFGVEFEARKSLAMLHPQLADFSVGGNFAFIQSSTDLNPLEYQFKTNILPHAESTRPLFEQSPYILNLDASYDNPASGTGVSLIFNVSGPRLILASLTSEDVYEQPAPTVDLIFSQRIGRKASIKLTAKNLLDSIRERTYGEDGNLIFSSYRVGRTFGVSLSYDF